MASNLVSVRCMMKTTQPNFSRFLMMPYIILKISHIGGNDKITCLKYVGLGFGIIFHPLAKALDILSSWKMEFNYPICLELSSFLK